MAMNWNVLIKPLGMARVLETLLSIISFGCTIDFHGSLSFIITCPPGSLSPQETMPVEWRYPFWLTSIRIDSNICNQSMMNIQPQYDQLFFVDFGVQAQFFVFVGVCSFISSVIWVVLYVGFWRVYSFDTTLPTLDIVASVIGSLFWLCADCAWASAYENMQMYLSNEQVQRSVNAFNFCQNGGKCALEEEKKAFGNGGFGLTLGFINCIMWILHAFLAYREDQRIKFDRDRLTYTSDAFEAQATAVETMDATSINPRVGFRAI